MKKKCYALSWSQEKHKQHKTLCKDLTEIANEKNLAKAPSKISKEKNISFMSSSYRMKNHFYRIK